MHPPCLPRRNRLIGNAGCCLDRGCNRLSSLVAASLSALVCAIFLAILIGELLKAEALLSQVEALRAYRVRLSLADCLKQRGLALASLAVQCRHLSDRLPGTLVRKSNQNQGLSVCDSDLAI